MEMKNLEDVLFKLNLLMDYQKIYKDPDLSQTKLAALVGVHYGELSKIINSYYGISYRKWLNNYRIEKLVAEINILPFKPKIQDCMAMVGFRTRDTFCNAFKSKMGSTISEYYSNQKKNGSRNVIYFELGNNRLKKG
jgi:AraC-like DNA-binding protein